MTVSDTWGQDQSAPSDPRKPDANPPLILTKPLLIVNSASHNSSIFFPFLSRSLPVLPPSVHATCPHQGLPDFAITPDDKQRAV